MMDTSYLFFVFAITTTLNLVIADPPEIFTNNKYNLKEAGETVQLRCSSNQRPIKVTWLKDEIPLNTLSPGFSSDDDGRNLYIVNLTRGSTQEGSYKCNVTNSDGEYKVLEYPFTVRVTYVNDEFVYNPVTATFYNISDSDPLTRLAWTNCGPPEGFPTPTVIWINGSSGLPINKSHPRIFTQDFLIRTFRYYQIQIRNASIYDIGNWSCRSVHSLKNQDAIFGVQLFTAPDPPSNLQVKRFFIKRFEIQWDYLRKDIQHYDLRVENVDTGKIVNERFREFASPAFFKTDYIIKNVEHEQQYKISLRATDDKDQIGEYSDPITITVPKNIRPYMTGSILFVNYVKEGSDVEINCPAEGIPDPSVVWIRDNETLIESQKYVFSGKKLTIKNIIRGESAKIRCRAVNSEGSDESNEMDLKVEWISTKFEEPPLSKVFYPKDKTIRVQSRLPNGFPRPEIRYMQDGRNVTTVTHPQYTLGFTFDTIRRLAVFMEIRTPIATNQGLYKAIASNGAGTVEAEFRLGLAGPPGKITEFKISTASKSVLVEWEPPKSTEKIAELGPFFKYRLDIKSYIIQYNKTSENSGVTFESFGEVTDDKFIRRRTILQNITAGIEYRARMRCVDHGNQESPWSDWVTFTLEQNEPPFIKTEPEVSPRINMGRNVTLSCVTESTETPTVTWFKNDQQLVENDQIEVLSNNSLAFYNANHEIHNGRYYCRASNTHGSTKSREANVKINYILEKFEFSMERVLVYDVDNYRHAVIRCLPPESHPSPQIFWTIGTARIIQEYTDVLYAKTNHIVDGKTYNALFVINAIANDSTRFGCVALNSELSPLYRIALTTVVLMKKPVWKGDIAIDLPTSTSVKLSWEKEREDIIEWRVAVRNGDNIISNATTTNTSIVFTGSLANLQYSYDVVMVDAAGQTSDPKTAVSKSGRPRLVKDLPKDYELKLEGNNDTLECLFSGNPFPSITWYFNGNPLDIDNTKNKDYFQITNTGQTLLLKNLSRNIHKGEYFCNATNEAGSAITTKIDYVVAYFDYKFAVADGNKEFYDADGERLIRFHCSPPMSSPFFLRDGNNMFWTKNNVNISKSNTDYKMDTITSNGLQVDRLEFNATSSSVGTYRCVYMSRGQRREHAMNLTLFDGPLRPHDFSLKEKSWNFAVFTWTITTTNINRHVIQYNKTENGLESQIVPADQATVKIRKLSATTRYQFTLYSEKDGKKSMFTNLMVETLSQPNIGKPGKPSNVNVPSIGLKEATISWSHPTALANNHPDELTYEVQICVSSCKIYNAGYNREFKAANLTEQTGYMFRITAISELDERGETYTGQFTTLTTGAPPRINNFRMLEKSWNFIRVGWDDVRNKQSLKEFVLTRRAQTNDIKEYRVNRDKTEFTFTSLRENISYQLEIKGSNEQMFGPVSGINVKTDEIGNAGPVTNVKFTLPDGYEKERLLIEWKTPKDIGNSNPADMAYRIIVCTKVNPSCKSYRVLFNETMFTVTGLEASTTYVVTIFTIKADGNNGGSFEDEIRTDEENEKPSKPKAVKMNKNSEKVNEVTLSWERPDRLAGNDVTFMKYRVQHCEHDGNNRVNCRQKDVDGTTTTLTNLTEGQRYEVNISAITFRGDIGDTETISFVTDVSTTTTAPTTSTSTVSTTTTTTTTSTTMSTTETRKTNPPIEEEESLSTGVVVGIVIAVIIILIIAIIAGAVYLRSRRTKNKFSRYSNRNAVQVEMHGRY